MPKPYTPNDKWSRRAAKEGYRARSVYKLMELDKKFSILKPGYTVLDFGAAPGSWMQYATEKVGKSGLVLGFDLQEIEPMEGNAKTFVQDITDTDGISATLEAEHKTQADCIISDLAPKTSGIAVVDQWKSIELSQSIVALADLFLKKGKWCVIKVLRGEDFDEFFRECKANFSFAKTAQVQASRDRSREVYVVLKK